jgi:hypothetical protein
MACVQIGCSASSKIRTAQWWHILMYVIIVLDMCSSFSFFSCFLFILFASFLTFSYFFLLFLTFLTFSYFFLRFLTVSYCFFTAFLLLLYCSFTVSLLNSFAMNDSSLLAAPTKKIKSARKVIHFKWLNKVDQIHMLCSLWKLKKSTSAAKEMSFNKFC